MNPWAVSMVVSMLGGMQRGVLVIWIIRSKKSRRQWLQVGKCSYEELEDMSAIEKE